MADNVAITAGSGTTIATENLTINSTAAQVQQVKAVFGALDTYTGQQGGRLVDGSATAAAGFTDPRIDGADVLKNPTINTGAYTAGFVIGGIIDFGAMARAAGSPPWREGPAECLAGPAGVSPRTRSPSLPAPPTSPIPKNTFCPHPIPQS